MNIEKTKIYGVSGMGNQNPSLTRTDDAVDLSYSVGETEIISDFDYCYPWCEMTEVVDEAGNVFIRIPKFYSKKVSDENGVYTVQISGVRYDGFITHFIDGKGNELDYVLVGKYEGSGSSAKVFSKSGQSGLVNITGDNFRNGCRANGAGYQQYDILIDAIIKDLFVVEFATTHCQSIMKGFTDGESITTTGQTDSIPTASGSQLGNTNFLSCCKYRGIENPWGNIQVFTDGISYSQDKVYLAIDPVGYEAGKTTAPYFFAFLRNPSMSGRISKLALLKHQINYYTAVSAPMGSYYSDYAFTNSTGQVAYYGGQYSSYNQGGLWSIYSNAQKNTLLPNGGGRLCFKPIG